MGALATFAPWIPEDDLLLKNAVEAGASLESLAKGAVQFSRRYSFREIQDRWYSLLYDPIISAEASAGMTNYELSAAPLPSRFVKFGQSKERKTTPAKRKAESVRASYYAMRKRICNDAFTSMDLSMDLSFLVDPENGNYVANGTDTLPENCVPEGETSNHFGFQGSDIDPENYAFPENMMDGGVSTNEITAQAYYTGDEEPTEENFHSDQKNILKEDPQILRDNVSLNGAVEEVGVPKEFAIDSFIGDNDLEKLPDSTFDHIDSDPGNLGSEFKGDHVFVSPKLECGSSFNTVHLSPLPEMSVWRTEHSIQEPDIPCDDFSDSIPCGEDYLAELSNSLLNFTNEEELFLMDVDGKDGIDKSYYDGLSSLLLSSPNDVSSDQMPQQADTESIEASQEHVPDLSVSCKRKVDDHKGSQSSNAQTVHKLELQVPSSASFKDPKFPERVNGVILCTLNAEESEVPSNDDVFLPFDVPPSTFSFSSNWTYKESNMPTASSVQDYGLSNHKASDRGKMTKVDQKSSGESRGSSQMVGSPPYPGSVGSSKVKCEFPSSHTSHTLSRSAVTVSGGLVGNKLANTTNALVHANPKEEPTNVGLAKYQSDHVTNSFTEKPAIGSNNFRSHPLPNGAGMKQEKDVALPIQDHHSQHAEVGSSDVPGSELVENPPTLDEEEQYIESDDEVPYYSDIEAMILDMDLDPDDQDLFYNEEVSRYQHEETKRTVVRLEQGAHSYMQRAIASHGAFAILYGRHSKHYIKKPEVLLGRATEGVPVDIDLGKGGYANKISRRQIETWFMVGCNGVSSSMLPTLPNGSGLLLLLAIIKMDKDGSFYIKNFGKSSILVNNKEVHTGQSQRLHSNCLIELRGMPFIFETNQSCVKQYLDHTSDNAQAL